MQPAEKFLGTACFRDFVEKTKEAATNAGESVANHFADVSKMIEIGIGGQRKIDVMLTRCAQHVAGPRHSSGIVASCRGREES